MRWAGAFSLTGPTAMEMLSGVFLDKAFIGACGIDVQRGATTIEPDEAAVFRAMVRQAKQVIVLADSSKVAMISPALICPVADIDILITDSGITPEALGGFKANGVQVLAVSRLPCLAPLAPRSSFARSRLACCLAAVLIAILPSAARAADGAQQFADLGQCKLESGQTIQNCRIGYRTFGQLNAARDNAILMPTWLYGRSADLVSLFGDGSSPPGPGRHHPLFRHRH